MNQRLLFVPIVVTALAAWPAAEPRDRQMASFDATRTSHHFYLYEDGGAIQVTVNERKDRANLMAIRAHLPPLVQMFASGDFTVPGFIHAQDVPGAETMKRLKDRIAYAYDEIPNGGQVRLTTRHARALSAIHEFLRFQIADHKTGDPLEVTRTP